MVARITEFVHTHLERARVHLESYEDVIASIARAHVAAPPEARRAVAR